jgi:hypothetical protein
MHRFIVREQPQTPARLFPRRADALDPKLPLGPGRVRRVRCRCITGYHRFNYQRVMSWRKIIGKLAPTEQVSLHRLGIEMPNVTWWRFRIITGERFSVQVSLEIEPILGHFADNSH